MLLQMIKRTFLDINTVGKISSKIYHLIEKDFYIEILTMRKKERVIYIPNEICI